MATWTAPSADIDPSCVIGEGSVVWHLAQLREETIVGIESMIGRGVYIDAGVHIGARSKIQNHALVYHPARLSEGVFIGPAAVLTNDRYPRATNPDGSTKAAQDWQPAGVTVEYAASVGAGAICLGGITIGRHALVAAGAVVTKDVPDFALVAGNPAVFLGWVGRTGHRLRHTADDLWVCPELGDEFQVEEGRLRRL